MRSTLPKLAKLAAMQVDRLSARLEKAREIRDGAVATLSVLLARARDDTTTLQNGQALTCHPNWQVRLHTEIEQARTKCADALAALETARAPLRDAYGIQCRFEMLLQKRRAEQRADIARQEQQDLDETGSYRHR